LALVTTNVLTEIQIRPWRASIKTDAAVSRKP